MEQHNQTVTFLWIESPRSERLRKAQMELERSCQNFGLSSQHYTAGPDLVRFDDVLRFARSSCVGSAFVWANSDITLTKNPFLVPDPTKVYGFFRRELPSNEINHGVDMYYIPIKWWDDYLSKDVPSLYLGASYVDRWITVAMKKIGQYENLTGYIDHITHERSEASGNDTNVYYQKNFREFNRWAKKNGVSQIQAPPYLVPKFGHVWGMRDLISKIKGNVKGKCKQ